MDMRKYWAIFLINLKDAWAYRVEGLVYFVADLVTPLVMIIVWDAIYQTSASVNGFTRSQMLFYYLYIFIARTLLSVYPHDFSRRVKTGEFSFYLLKPVGILYSHLATELSWKLVRPLFLCISVVIIYFVYLPGVQSGLSLVHVFLVPIVWGSAFLLNFYLKIILEVFSFWITESDGIRLSFYAFEALLSGSLLPLSFLPGAFGAIAKILPFGLYYSLPAQSLVGTLSLSEIYIQLGLLLFWLVAAYFIAKVLLARGIRQYSAVGN